MSEDKSKVDEANEERKDEDDEPDVEAHSMRARRMASPEEPQARAKRPTTH
jgi:hypothetical protein